MRSSLLYYTLSRLLILGSAILQFACGSSREATVYLVDGTENTGPLLFVSDTSVTLSPIPVLTPDLGMGFYREQPRSYPNNRIERVTLLTERTDSDATRTRIEDSVGGVVLGAFAGAMIGTGNGYSSGSSSGAITGGIVIGVVGGFVGAAIGSSVTKDTVVFDPKIETQRDSLRLLVLGK